MPKINATLEDHQEKYQPTMIEFESNIYNDIVSIVINRREILCYISPKIVEVSFVDS